MTYKKIIKLKVGRLMKTQKTYQPSAEEQTIIDIMKRLSPSRSSELLDFAEFLTRREVKDNLNPPDHQSLTEAEVSVNEKNGTNYLLKPKPKVSCVKWRKRLVKIIVKDVQQKLV